MIIKVLKLIVSNQVNDLNNENSILESEKKKLKMNLNITNEK